MWSGAWNKRKLTSEISNRFLPSSVGRTGDWWSGGHGSKQILFCSVQLQICQKCVRLAHREKPEYWPLPQTEKRTNSLSTAKLRNFILITKVLELGWIYSCEFWAVTSFMESVLHPGVSHIDLETKHVNILVKRLKPYRESLLHQQWQSCNHNW